MQRKKKKVNMNSSAFEPKMLFVVYTLYILVSYVLRDHITVNPSQT